MASKNAVLNIIFGADTKDLDKALGNVSKRLRRTAEDIGSLGQSLSIGLTAPLAGLGALATKNAVDSAKALAQVEAAVTSTGGAAGKSVGQLEDMATSLQRMSLFDDDEILKDVTANLLTFTNIAGPQFDKAQQAILDMSTRLGTDLTSASVQVGKALNNPIKGVKALGRAGVQFSADQVAMIESLQESGDIAGAQNIILKELETQFGGAAQAAANVDPYTQLANEIGNLSEDFGAIINEALIPLVAYVRRGVDAVGGWSDETKRAVVITGAFVAALGPILVGVGALINAYTTVKGALMAARAAQLALNVAALANPYVAVAAAVVAAVALIITNWDTLKSYFNSGGGAAVFTSLKDTVVAAINTVQLVFQKAVEFIEIIWQRFGTQIVAYATNALDLMLGVFKGAFEVIGNAFNAFSSFLKGDWSAFFGYLANIPITVMGTVVRTVIGAFEQIGTVADAVLSSFGFESKIGPALDGLQQKVDKFFQGLKYEGDQAEQATTSWSDSLANLFKTTTKTAGGAQTLETSTQSATETTRTYNDELADQLRLIEATFQVTGDYTAKVESLTKAYQDAAIAARLAGESARSAQLAEISRGGGQLTPRGPSQIANPALDAPRGLMAPQAPTWLEGMVDGADMKAAQENLQAIENIMANIASTSQQLGSQFGTAFGMLVMGAEGAQDAMRSFATSAVDAAFQAATAFAVQAATQSSLAAGPGAAIIMPALITAGIGLMREVFKGITGLATGGLTTGPMLAMIGDNPSGKEAVIPFERMGEFLNMAGAGQSQHVTVSGRLRGRDIMLSNERSLSDRKRIR